MARKRRQSATVSEQNHERWMVSYADFITLLFAFFVVMYAVSSVNEGKYRVLSESLSNAFRVPARSLEPIQIGAVQRNTQKPSSELINKPSVILRPDVEPPPLVPKKGEVPGAGDKPMLVLFQGLQASVAELSDRGMIQVTNNEFGVEIEISSQVLFQTGQAQLSDGAKPVLQKLANVLAPFPHDINVQGYTDNVPITSPIYPSNWELSAARAVSVVQTFMAYGINAKRLSATGYGEFRPVANNETAQGRQKNRRVIIFVPAHQDKAQVVEAINRLGKKLNRGTPFDQPAGRDPREGIKQIEEAPANKIIEPANETGFSNPQTGAQNQSVNSEQIQEAEQDVRTQGGQRHISRQPIGTQESGQ